MRVLVACEFSGVVRDAFAHAGHWATSCDLLPSESPDFNIMDPESGRRPFGSARHLQRDVREVLDDGWDLMIANPPCTHLAVSGARWFKDKQAEQAEALEFVRTLLDAPIPRIALENPVSIISTRIRKPDQVIHPWQYGHPESKTTCLWLKNLPSLQPTEILECARFVDGKPRWENQTPGGSNKHGPSPDRWRIRSRTYPGIARAMAEQWGAPRAER